MSLSLTTRCPAGLYVVDVENPLPDRCRVRAWRPEVDGVSEVFHARIVDYGYPKHMHDTWTVLIVDDGAISYDLDKRHCGAFGQTVAILPPGVAHDGKPAPGAGAFTKRVLYLDPSFLPESLIGAAVDNTSIRDPDLRRALVAFHGELEYRPDPFDAETRLALIAERFSDHFSTDHFVSIDPERPIARGLREFLDAHATQPITLAAAALHFDRTKPHLVRSFTATYGLPPHAYLIGKRVEAARKLLLAGVPPSEAALTAGFYDQSHLTRHFKRHTSVPPATYAASNRFG